MIQGTDSAFDNDVEAIKSNLLLKSHKSLVALPVRTRWEVTRRHPYYLDNWELASRAFRGQLQESEKSQGELAKLILQGIGVNGDPPAPSNDFDAFDSKQLAQCWKNGAVAPITPQGLLATMILSLTPEQRICSADHLLSSTRTPGNGEDERSIMLEVLTEALTDKRMQSDQMTQVPMISVNMEASKQSILDAVGSLVDEWKKARQIPERRSRADKLEEYLKVWDLREGWANGYYEIDRDKSFDQIAKELHISERTAANHYYAAFAMISGHKHSLDNYVRLFSRNKLAHLANARSFGRRRSTPGHRGPSAISESVLRGDHDWRDGDALVSMVGVSSQNDVRDTVLDIRELINKNKSDDEIIAELELSDTSEVRLHIQYFRDFGIDSAD